jgi:ABC-2 type transport system permease protein
MHKYFTIFSVSWQNEFVYRLNFLLWRLRNILRLLMTYFLWRGIFLTNVSVFGYNRSDMLTYVFLVLVVQAVVLSAPSADNIGGEIGSGDLSNYLVKPVNYLRYWFTRDIASKILNILFSFFEVFFLWLLLRPQLYFHTGFALVAAFLVSCLSAAVLYFLVEVSNRLVAFWTPENTWGLSFLFIILIEILGGNLFPLDVLPAAAQTFLQFTPFPYLVYYPIAIILGKVTGWVMVRIVIQSLLWCLVMFLITRFVWRKGLKVYAASGR